MNRKRPEILLKRPLSLAQRLTILIGTLLTGLFIVFGWLIQNSIEHHFKVQDTQELEVLVHTVQEVLSDDQGDVNLSSTRQRFAEASVGHHGMYLYIEREDGKTVFSSTETVNLAPMARLTSQTDHITPETLELWQVADHRYRGSVLRLGRDSANGRRPFLVVVAKSMDFHQAYLAKFQNALWMTTLISVLVTFLVLWWAIYRGHAPLRSITAEIQRISTDRMNVRLSPDAVPIELADLATSFNGMLDRIEDAFSKLSNFSTDIAHELRTPVTNLMTQTQVVLSHTRTNDEYKETLYSNLEEYERMAQMVNDMLFLAKGDNGQLVPNVTSVDLGKEILELFEYFDAWAEERNVHLVLDGNDATIIGDRLMLRRAISNLLSNAIQHTASGHTVSVSLTKNNDEIRLIVKNPGPEISTQHLPRLFDRFYRMEPSRNRSFDEDGAGLGLSIVKSIVDVHGGTVSACSSHGFVHFSMVLPKCGVSN